MLNRFKNDKEAIDLRVAASHSNHEVKEKAHQIGQETPRCRSTADDLDKFMQSLTDHAVVQDAQSFMASKYLAVPTIVMRFVLTSVSGRE